MALTRAQIAAQLAALATVRAGFNSTVTGFNAGGTALSTIRNANQSPEIPPVITKFNVVGNDMIAAGQAVLAAIAQTSALVPSDSPPPPPPTGSTAVHDGHTWTLGDLREPGSPYRQALRDGVPTGYLSSYEVIAGKLHGHANDGSVDSLWLWTGTTWAAVTSTTPPNPPPDPGPAPTPTPLPAGAVTEHSVTNAHRYRVGSVYYSSGIDALAALNAGGTLIVEAGKVINSPLPEILIPNLTIRGDDGDYPIFRYGITAGKGTFLWSATGGLVEHIRFEQIGGLGDAIAAIRLEVPFLTVRDCQGSYCENFLLGGHSGRFPDKTPGAGLVTLDNLTLDHCGHFNGKAHAIYIGAVAQVVLTNSRLYDSILGHLFKSRAANNIIDGNVFRKGTASRAIDIPNGGILSVTNNQFDQASEAANYDIIAYAAELPDFDPSGAQYWRDNSIRVNNNTLSNSFRNQNNEIQLVWFNDWLVPADKVVEAPKISAPIPDIVMAPVATVPVLTFTPGDAWWDALVVGQVYEVADTKMRVLQSQFPPGFIDHGIQGFVTWMGQYSGAAFDHDNGDFYLMAGGHMASSNNCMLGFALETMTPRIVMQPSVITQAVLSQAVTAWNTAVPWMGEWNTLGQGVNAAGEPDDEWPDGKPTAIHTYSSLAYLNGKVCSGRLLKMWQIDITTGVATADPVDLPQFGIGALAVADTVNNLVVRCGSVGDNYDDIRTYDPATHATVIRAPLTIGVWPMGGEVAGREVICFGGSYLVGINMDTWAQRIIRLNYSFFAYPGNAWAGDIGRYLVPLFGGEVGAMDIATGACSVLDIKGSMHPHTFESQTGPYGRFRYYARRKVLACLQTVDTNVRIVKLA